MNSPQVPSVPSNHLHSCTVLPNYMKHSHLECLPRAFSWPGFRAKKPGLFTLAQIMVQVLQQELRNTLGTKWQVPGPHDKIEAVGRPGP